MNQFAQHEFNDADAAFRRSVQLCWSWSWLIVLVGALAAVIAFLVSKQVTPKYEASSRLLVSAPSTISGVDPSTGLITMQTLTSTYTQMLMDQSVLEGVIQQLKLPMTPEGLAKSVSVQAITNTQLLQITVQDTDPARAAEIANAMATVFVARIQDLRSQRYAVIRDGLAAQVSSMEQQIASTSSQIAAIDQQIAAGAAQEAGAVQTQIAAAAIQPAVPVATKFAPAATQTVTAMQQQIAVAATETALAAPATVEPAALLQLQDRLTQYRTIYSNLVLSYEQVRLSEEQTSTNVALSQRATVPTAPVTPKTFQNAVLAALIGMLLTVAGVIVFDKVDATIKDPQEVRRDLGVPVLGIIPWHKVPTDKPTVLAEPYSPPAEAFRLLRTNIAYGLADRALRRILVASAIPQDGKTMVACNLAVLLSQSGKRVLLVDADLRRPQVYHRFGLQNRSGLSDLLTRPLDDIGTIIKAVDPPKLAVLTAGELPANPAELLTSHAMSQTLDALNREFDLVVIDTPALLAVTDAAALAPLTDGVVLVARPGMTRLADLRQSMEQLKVVGARVLGVVLNEVKPSSPRYGYYYNSNYSKYYQPSAQQAGRTGTVLSEPEPAALASSEEPEAVAVQPNPDGARPTRKRN